MFAADHAVRNDRAQQRFDGGEDRDRKRRPGKISHQGERHVRHMRRRQATSYVSKSRADGLDRHIGKLHDSSGDDQRHERGREFH